MKSHLFAFFAILVTLSSCGKSPNPAAASDGSFNQQASVWDGHGGQTIVYNVYLKPIVDSGVELEAEESLANFNREAFVDSLFQSVYYHKARITNFLGDSLSIEDVKTLEIEDPNYSRDKLAGVQFTEEWFLNPATRHLEKKVISMLVGYEVYDQNGDYCALRPGLVIHFD